jgi:hypothetical protein
MGRNGEMMANYSQRMAHFTPCELENSIASFSKNGFSNFLGVTTWTVFEVGEAHFWRMK